MPEENQERKPRVIWLDEETVKEYLEEHLIYHDPISNSLQLDNKNKIKFIEVLNQ
jgi:hypothetical protein